MEENATTGVTLSLLKELQETFTVSASKALGQNFLVDPNICRKIAESIEPNQKVIEIGPGIGSLTVPLAKLNEKVIAIEYDAHILAPLENVLSRFDVTQKVEIINSDVMTVDLEEICKEQNISTIIGNLPYNISAPLLADICLKVPSANNVVAMVQKEVGQRLAAAQGSRAVSAITLKCQYYMDIQLLFEVPSQLFIPRPRVDSVVISMTRHKNISSTDTSALFSLIDLSFSQRRKMLRQSLKSVFGVNATQIFENAQVLETARPEQCTLEQFTRLCDAYKEVID